MASPFPLDVRYDFGGIQHSPVDGCSAASVILEFSKKKMNTCPSTLTFDPHEKNACILLYTYKNVCILFIKIIGPIITSPKRSIELIITK